MFQAHQFFLQIYLCRPGILWDEEKDSNSRTKNDGSAVLILQNASPCRYFVELSLMCKGDAVLQVFKEKIHSAAKQFVYKFV